MNTETKIFPICLISRLAMRVVIKLYEIFRLFERKSNLILLYIQKVFIKYSILLNTEFKAENHVYKFHEKFLKKKINVFNESNAFVSNFEAGEIKMTISAHMKGFNDHLSNIIC